MARSVLLLAALIATMRLRVHAWVGPARSLSRLRRPLRPAMSTRAKYHYQPHKIRFPAGIEFWLEPYNICGLGVASPRSSAHDPRGLELARPDDPDLRPGGTEAENENDSWNRSNVFGHSWKTQLWRFWRAWRSDSWSAWIAFGAAGLVFDGLIRSWSLLRSRGVLSASHGLLAPAAAAPGAARLPPPSPSPEAQVLECDVCGSQMRPARGRGAIVVGSPSFRCPHCGADGSHFFDIDDSRDERARRRVERMKENELEDLIDY